jgi:OmpA-OmpF porin, OOP family
MIRMTNHIRRLSIVGALLCVLFGSACATKKYVVGQVQTGEKKLSARLDTQEAGIQTNTNQITELVSLNKQNRQQIESVRNEVQVVDGKAGAATQAADQAQKIADRAQDAADLVGTRFTGLADQFANRNHYGVVAEKSVHFRFGESRLPSAELPALEEAARLLGADPNAVAILEGRTDTSGDKDYNIQLGQRRLDAVARYLVVEKDVPTYRIYRMSYGPEKPLADNRTKEGRSQNRSTVIRILAPQAAGAPQPVAER